VAEAPLVVNAFVNGSRISVLRRDADGELRETKVRAEYSLFVHRKDADAVRPLRARRTFREEGDFLRIICQNYDERDRLCRGIRRGERGWFEQKNIETYEADLSPVRRWLIDTGAKIQKPRPGYLDLEDDSRVPWADKANARILCWGLIVPQENGPPLRFGGVLEEWTDEAESELILDLFHELAMVDQILAWNGDRIDFERLEQRIEKLGLNIQLRRWLRLDHMELFKKFHMTASDSGDEKASVALDRVAKSLGVAGKAKLTGVGELAGVPVGGKHSYKFWKSGGRNRQLLLLYCVEDAMTMYRIEHGDGVKPGTLYVYTLAALAQTCGVFPDSRGMKGLNFVESFVMRIGAQRGMRAPTKYGYGGKAEEDREKFKGAFVFPTKRGLHFDVHICDFARLYPSIMQAWNMSPETYIGPALTGELDPFGIPIRRTFEEACAKREPGVAVCPMTLEQFRVDGPRGLFAAALDIIVEERKYWSKKALEYPIGSPERIECERIDAAYKIIANTFYGVSGSPFSRYFMRELSESVTQIGVWLIKATSEQAAKWRKKLETIAGDTDSGFLRGCTEVEFAEYTKFCNEDVYPSMIAPTGANADFISVAFEKSFAIMANVEKKTYAGRMLHKKGKRAKDDDDPTIKGLEYKRGDTARLARDFQEEVVREVLMIGKPLPPGYGTGGYPITARQVERIVERWQKMILEREFSFDDAVIAKAMKKPIKEYGGKQSNGQAIPIPAHVQIAALLEKRGEPVYTGVKIEYVVVDGKSSPMKCAPAADVTIDKLDVFYLWESLVWPAAARVLGACFPDYPWKRWGSVRPLRGTLPGQEGFGFGERKSPPLRH
jgi:DNA polymerase elongation subunit (family B)